MINVKQAVRTARDYITNLYDGQPLAGLLLEETELSEDGKDWLITYGFDTDRLAVEPTYSNLAAVLSPNLPKYVRDYKVIKIDSETGEVESMKIRQV